MKKEAILLSTHFMNDFVLGQYSKLKESLENNSDKDIFLLIESDADDISLNIPDDINYYPFSIDTLNRLEYEPIAETIIPGSNHFQVLQFYKDNPHYNYYWNIEYDVYFNGDWNVLFDYCKLVEADFITSRIENFSQNLNPNWIWWNSLKLKTLEISDDQYISSFNPIYRISSNALCALDEILSKGNSGHHEVLIPTVLNHLGFKISDFGGDGDYVIGKKNFLYYFYYGIESIYNTMRYRPLFNREELELGVKNNLLYHPVKD